MSEKAGVEVFVTVGTDHHPFDRLVSWVDAWACANPQVRVFAQHGTSVPLRAGENAALVRADEMARLLRTSHVVVTHGGPATIMEIRRHGKVPVVVPRDPALGEHVDDHQLRFAARLARLGEAIVVTDAAEFHRVLSAALRRPAQAAVAGGHGETAAALFGEVVDVLLAGGPPGRAPRRPRVIPAAGPASPEPVTPMPEWRVLFLAGWGRSGSTLAARLLARSPKVVAVGEVREIFGHGMVEDRLCGCGQPFSSCPMWTEVGRVAFGGWGNVDGAELAKLARRFDRIWAIPRLLSPWQRLSAVADLKRYLRTLQAIYGAVHAVTGATVIVDTSKLASSAILTRRSVPDGVGVVHLVRDSRGVAFSWGRKVTHHDRAGEPVEMERYGALAASLRYVGYNALVDVLGRRWLGTPRRVRYEDLVADPEAVTRAMLDHLGMADLAVAELVDPATRQALVDIDHTVDGNPMRHGDAPLEVRPDERWRDEMRRGRRAIVTAVTYPWLRRYGYVPRAR